MKEKSKMQGAHKIIAEQEISDGLPSFPHCYLSNTYTINFMDDVLIALELIFLPPPSQCILNTAS